MIITCPSCGASFNIKAEALGPNGRSVKCSKCAHRWHASPEDGAPKEPAPAIAPAPAEEEPEVPPPASAQDADEGSVETAPAQEPDVAAGDGALGDQATAAESPEPEAAAPASEDAEAADAGTAADGAGDGQMTPSPGMREALGLGGDDAASDEGAEAAPKPRRGGSAPKQRRKLAKVLSIFVLLLILAGAGGAAVFMKQEIMMWLPATQRLYAMVGMGPAALGQGLKIVEPKPKKELDGNDEILVVEGEIENIADKPIDVPLMRGALLDKQGKELHIWTFTAAKSRIAPGELARYRTEFRNPPAAAQSLDITFTKANAITAEARRDATAKPAAAAPEKAPTQQH